MVSVACEAQGIGAELVSSTMCAAAGISSDRVEARSKYFTDMRRINDDNIEAAAIVAQISDLNDEINKDAATSADVAYCFV